MPGPLVEDEMGLGKTFTSVATALICQMLTEKVVVELPWTILWGNTLQECVNVAQNNTHRINGEEQERYP